MIARFFVLWIILTAAVLFWFWCLPTAEKKIAKFWLKRGAIAALIALILMSVVLSLNHISGV